MMLGIKAIQISIFAYSLLLQPASRARQINLRLFGKNLTLTLDVGTLGLIIALVLLTLLIGSILLSLLARRRTRQAQVINRKLKEQIAERERVQKSLTDTQQRTQAIIETAIDGIVTMDHEGRIVEFNPAAEHIFGYRRDDVIGKPLASVIIPPELREFHRRGLEKYLATGEGPALGKRLEITGLKSDGSSVLLELTVVRMPGSDVPMFTGFIRDITERKRSEQKAHSQLVRLDLLQQITRAIAERQDLKSIFQVVLRSLEENLPLDFTCVCLYEPATQVLAVSQVGSKNEQLSLELASPAHSSIDLKENAMTPAMEGELVYEADISKLNFSFTTKLRAAALHSLVMAPLPVEGKVFGLIIAARNEVNGFNSSDCEFMRQLSEHVALAAHQAQLYQALQQSYEDLRQTQQAVLEQERLRALGQMASGIAHDINNAISPIALYTESLLESEPNLSSKARHALETIHRAIDDVAATVSRMREFSRRPEQQKALQPVDLNRLVRQALDLTRAKWSGMAQQQGIMIDAQVDLQPELPAIAGVESEIREALTNLIFNAVDAMPEGGKLVVRTRTDEAGQASSVDYFPRQVQLEVEDTGIGMDEETRQRALEPFFTTKGERGTGLGLAMVYGMAERHGADIHIDSSPGAGTIVRLNFMFAGQNGLSVNEPGTQKDLLTSKRILIVDDDRLVLKSLCEVLAKDGHEVVPAHGGQQGIDTFLEAQHKRDPFDIVITDLGMPYVDGRQVASAVKLASPVTPVILLTGWGQRLVADGEVPTHVDWLVNKPPKLLPLREALMAVCQKS